MAIGIVGTATGNSGSGTATVVSVTLPGSIPDGSLAIAVVNQNTGTGITISPGTGWSEHATSPSSANSTNTARLLTRSVGSADSGQSTTIGTLSAARGFAQAVIVLSGATGIDNISEGTDTGTDTTVGLSTFTPVADDCLMVALIGSTYGSSTVGTITASPGGYTERAETKQTVGAAPVAAAWIGTNQLTGQGGVQQSSPSAGTYSQSATDAWFMLSIEPAATGQEFTETVNDGAGLADTVAPVVGYARSQTDAAGVADAVTTALEYARSQTDAAGLADALASVLAYARTQIDSSGLADSLTAALAAARSFTDSAGLSDSIDAQVGKLVSVTDPAGLADALALAMLYARTATDTAGLADALATVAGYSRPATDAAGLADALVAALAASRTATDVVGLADGLVASIGHARTHTDTAGVTDALTVELVTTGGIVVYGIVRAAVRHAGGPTLGARPHAAVRRGDRTAPSVAAVGRGSL